ncbi:MAG: quinolinate synthase NadA, partial [Desulfonatronovibrionaceae bacterium]
AKMLAWALEEGDGALFLPDRHLGINTANDLGIPEKERQILDIRSAGGNIDFSAAAAKKMLFWPGVCAVHHRLKPKYLHRVRVNDPEAKIIVHPECSPEVVEIADSKGSTSTIINYVQQAPAGSTIYVGTEDNLVRRLAADFAPNKAIRPLFPTYCSNMAKITPEKLLDTLQDLDPINRVEVDPNMALQARKALETMLKVCF